MRGRSSDATAVRPVLVTMRCAESDAGTNGMVWPDGGRPDGCIVRWVERMGGEHGAAAQVTSPNPPVQGTVSATASVS